LTINGVTVMRVLPEPGGLHCSCAPASHAVEVPLADALGLLGPGVNQLGIRKSTGLPGQARSALAWAYAAITIGGAEQRVDTCDDGHPCTIAACSPAGCTHTPVTCAPADQCHDAGVCAPTTGLCSNPTTPDGASCNDGNACTQTDTCQAGTCTGANPVVCAAAD